jgi:hypothetical protein
MITQMIHSYHQYHTIPHGSIQILSVTGASSWRGIDRQAPNAKPDRSHIPDRGGKRHSLEPGVEGSVMMFALNLLASLKSEPLKT